MSERLTYVEIDLLVCPLTYGQAPCSAALGVTGDVKCFNTLATCQDRNAYLGATPAVQTLRLAKATLALDPDIDALPNITSVSYSPSRINLGESIGVRSTLTIQCKDHPTPDTDPGGDPYLESRDYDPYSQGTFWGKFKARHTFLRGRTVRWINGRLGQTIEQMETRTFVVDRISGPSTDGSFTIVAKDPLTLTDDKRAQAPRLSRGVLDSDISNSATSLTLSPSGIGSEYPASGFAAIGGNEIVEFTRSGDVMSITRAQFNTEASAHDEGDRVQLCLRYSGERPDDIISDLLINYANIPASFINSINWEAEVTEFIPFAYTALIPEPVAVEKLVNEMLEQAAVSIWWDEIGAALRLQVLRNISVNTFIHNDDVMMAGSFSQRDNPEKRVSHVWTYYGQINPLESLEDRQNYRNSLITVSSESVENYGEPSYKTIFSRWITRTARPNVESLNTLILSRYGRPPKTYNFDILRDSGSKEPILGGGARVKSIFNQNALGLSIISPGQFVRIRANDSTWSAEVEEITVDGSIAIPDPTIKVVPIDNSLQNFDLREAYLSQYNEANPGDTVICEIRSGILVNSINTSSFAWRTGTGWPSGITLRLIILQDAVLAGAAGRGGNATAVIFGSFPNRGFSISASNGGDGGPAVLIEHPIEIENYGTIGGGGGGGAGGAALYYEQFVYKDWQQATASGGGSGAGSVAASGGSTSAAIKPKDVLVRQADQKNGGQGSLLSGGSSIRATVASGSVLVLSRGGQGGALGQAGGATIEAGSEGGGGLRLQDTGTGGAAGPALNGGSMVTFIEEGDIRGAQIN